MDLEEAKRVTAGTSPSDPMFVVTFAKMDLAGPDVELNLKLQSGNYPATYESESEEKTEWNGFPAYRVKAKGTGDESEIRAHRMTVYANGIFYNVGISGFEEQVDQHADRFFNSFKIQKD